MRDTIPRYGIFVKRRARLRLEETVYLTDGARDADTAGEERRRPGHDGRLPPRAAGGGALRRGRLRPPGGRDGGAAGHRRRGPGPHRPDRPARARQHAPPPEPDPDPRLPRRPGRGALRLAHRPVPGVDAHRRGGLADEHARGPRRAPPLRLHHGLRPHLPVPERQLRGRAGRGGARHRRALPREPGVDVGRPVEGGPAAGRGGGGRGLHPEGLRARHRPLPRPASGGA